MSKQEVLDKLKALGLNVKNISEGTGIPSARIYKWYKGNGLPKVEDFNKLLDYYEKMKPNPTNDHYDNDIEDAPNIAAEPDVLYELIKSQKKTIELLESKVMDLEEKLKPPVVSVGKTGGRRTSK